MAGNVKQLTFAEGVTISSITDTGLSFTGDVIIGDAAQHTAIDILTVGTSSGNSQIACISESLSNGEVSIVMGVGSKAGTSNKRRGYVGAYYHSGMTSNEACGYLGLDASDGTQYFIWVDDNDVLRGSKTASNIGTTTGTSIVTIT